MTPEAAAAAKVVRVMKDYVRAECAGCGWQGPLTPIRQVEGWAVAGRHADEHKCPEVSA